MADEPVSRILRGDIENAELVDSLPCRTVNGVGIVNDGRIFVTFFVTFSQTMDFVVWAVW